jgi:hypothetical protein
VTLREWLDGYRRFDPGSVRRMVAEPEDDWAEQDLFAPADRRRETTPRWMARARSVGYGRPTTI